MDPKKILKDSALFHEFNSLELLNVTEIARRCFLNKGDTVLTEGDNFEVDASLYIIASGVVKVLVPMGEGKELVLAILSAPGHFGEMSFVDHRPRSAEVVAMDETLLLQIDHDDLDRVLSENKDTSSKFYRSLSKSLVHKIRATNDKLTMGRYSNRTA